MEQAAQATLQNPSGGHCHALHRQVSTADCRLEITVCCQIPPMSFGIGQGHVQVNVRQLRQTLTFKQTPISAFIYRQCLFQGKIRTAPQKYIQKNRTLILVGRFQILYSYDRE